MIINLLLSLTKYQTIAFVMNSSDKVAYIYESTQNL